MERNPIHNDARRTRRARDIGHDAACVRCGTADPETLIAARRTLLEAHHVVGRAHDDRLTVPLCRNCHAILTEAQRTAGIDLTPPPTLLHQLAAVLAGLGGFFADVARLCVALAAGVTGFARGLDADYPGWRSQPWARPVTVSP
jgi:hypothetical protein